ncbi:hypothetical protein AJ78_07004 [Emergomyces pasteurianus Ep9510]|uniref:Ecp2 effector protein domain-containing protein n=1 Tax=Emergomyces pasteurianus Ep9510 TaxID=1447872 RepID=A0A1J9Q8Z1_9EURO|nr:hypothetical protein AJ78_07004 [Emergomyces pasteurianus Ep9510]
MKVRFPLSSIAAAAILTHVVAIDDVPHTYRGGGLSCYDNGWSVNGNYPSLWEATSNYCNKYKGWDYASQGHPALGVVNSKTPDGGPFKLNLWFYRVKLDIKTWGPQVCIQLFQNVLGGCEAVEGHDMGHFHGGAAHTKPFNWLASIDCENSS